MAKVLRKDVILVVPARRGLFIQEVYRGDGEVRVLEVKSMEIIEARLFCYKAISKENLWDVGNDPYFHSKPFSWGICRPNIRGSIEEDTRLFFYTTKGSAGDYYLTGMMKVEKKLTQEQAANESDLYCGHDAKTCPYQSNPKTVNCSSSDCSSEYASGDMRKCRCNIIVDREGKYKEFCDGDKHEAIVKEYRDKEIYFVSTVKDSVATKKPIRLLDYLDSKTEFWKYARFYGFELGNDIADKFEQVLRKSK